MAWNPWRALRGRTHVTLTVDPIGHVGGGALYGLHRGQAVVVLAPGLDYAGRRSALAHELIHDERRILSPSATPATMQHEEAQVRRETARRLVPGDELLAWVDGIVSVEPVTVAMVAEQWDVTEAVAREALRGLRWRLAP